MSKLTELSEICISPKQPWCDMPVGSCKKCALDAADLEGEGLGSEVKGGEMLTDKQHILNLKDGEKYIVPESDYGKAEVWLINEMYFLFEIPEFGGQPHYSGAYLKQNIDAMIKQYESWT